jgi:hypothetical protein
MKKMVVNCANCDMRNVSEETLKSYEQITVNAATVLVTPEKKDLIARYNVMLNVADVIEVPAGENVRVINQNGSYELTADRAPQDGETVLLFVNGVLNIDADAAEAAQKYYKINVNGSVTMPKSISGRLNNLSVNGSVSTYPDGAIRLNRNAEIDKTFPLRAKENALYWASRRLIFTDLALNVEKLNNLNVRFAAKTALIAESLAETVVPMLSEDTDILIVPDGTKFFGFDARMNKRFLKKFGTKAYINGDLTVEDDAEEILKEIEYLYVNGDVKIPEALADAFEDIDAHYDELMIQKKTGKIIEDHVRATVDKALLEKYEDGILVTDCAMVHIAKDVSPELILERLTIADCAQVYCTEQQEAAVSAVSKDVASIGGADESMKDVLTGALHLNPEFKVVNAAEYVM